MGFPQGDFGTPRPPRPTYTALGPRHPLPASLSSSSRMTRLLLGPRHPCSQPLLASPHTSLRPPFRQRFCGRRGIKDLHHPEVLFDPFDRAAQGCACAECRRKLACVKILWVLLHGNRPPSWPCSSKLPSPCAHDPERRHGRTKPPSRSTRHKYQRTKRRWVS